MRYIGYAQYKNKKLIGSMTEEKNQIIITEELSYCEDDYMVVRDDYEYGEDAIEGNKSLEDIWSAYYGYLYHELIIKTTSISRMVNRRVLLVLDHLLEYETALIELSNSDGELVSNIIESKMFDSEYSAYQELVFFEIILDAMQSKYNDDFSKKSRDLFYDELDVNNRIKSMRNMKKHEIFNELDSAWRELNNDSSSKIYSVKVREYEVMISNDSLFDSFIEPAIDFSVGEYEEIQDYYIEEDIDEIFVCSPLAEYEVFKDESEELFGIESVFHLDMLNLLVTGLTFFAYIKGANSQILRIREDLHRQQQVKLFLSMGTDMCEVLRRDKDGNFSYNEGLLKVSNTLSECIYFSLLSDNGHKKEKLEDFSMYLPFWNFNDTIRIRCSVDLEGTISFEFTHIETGVVSVGTYKL